MAGTCSVNEQTVTPVWRYQYWPLDVSQYILGNSVTDPSKITGATSKWQGCLEERDTVVASTFDPTNLPPDLDPDLAPTSTSTRWRPMWPDTIYYRGSSTSVDDAGSSTNPYGDSNNNFQFGSAANGYLQGGYLTCGKPVQRLTDDGADGRQQLPECLRFRALGRNVSRHRDDLGHAHAVAHGHLQRR